jgi:pimeloyl-ACP methyl ester carboxylesterase
MEIRTIRDSIRIAYEFFGPGNAPLVGLIPGAGAPAEFWPDFYCEELADKGFRILRYCHRDTGFSTHFDSPCDIWELLRDLEGLINSSGNQGVHLVGHSMGGFLAQMAACFSSLPIRSCVSISAGSAVEGNLCAELGMSMPSESTWKVLMQNQPSGVFENDLDAWVYTWRFLNGSLPFEEDLAIAYTKSLYEGDARNAQVAVNHVHAMSTIPAELVKELGRTACPFLVLHGTEDALVPYDNGEVTARLIPESIMVGLEGAGHMFFHTSTWNKILDHGTDH